MIKSRRTYSLILLDINLPDGDGLDLCRRIHKETPVPIILLTAKDLDEDILAGFDAGAVDYITKPFNTAILLKRVSVALERSSVHQQSEFTVGNLLIDVSRAAVARQGIPLRLTQAEWKLIHMFLLHHGQLLTRDQILEQLWDSEGNYVSEHTLTSLISRLRNKIADTQYQYIKTYYGLGYKWVGDADE